MVIMRRRDHVLKTLAEHRDALRQLGVRRLGLFGSAARGDGRPDSDLDFVVEFEAKTFDAYMDLLSLLEKLLDSRVDLVLEDAIKPRLRPIILAEAVHVPGF
jgi:predicted nucleotidyltransferase